MSRIMDLESKIGAVMRHLKAIDDITTEIIDDNATAIIMHQNLSVIRSMAIGSHEYMAVAKHAMEDMYTDTNRIKELASCDSETRKKYINYFVQSLINKKR